MRTILGLAALAIAAACSPPADTSKQSTPAQTEVPAPPAGPAVTMLTEADARTRLEGAGYTNITGLMQNPDGTWNATATKDGATATVTVTDSGVATSTAPAPTP